MNQQDEIVTKDTEATPKKRHPITMENSPEETIRRMRSVRERIAKFKEELRVQREANQS